MRTRPTEMTENVRVRTPCLLKGIREDREPSVVQRARRQVSLVVGGMGETDYGRVMPGEDGGKEWRRRAKGVT
jgi:hypothetical protein